jgi:hypothetical protein
VKDNNSKTTLDPIDFHCVEKNIISNYLLLCFTGEIKSYDWKR